jgi:hypothetical protein
MNPRDLDKKALIDASTKRIFSFGPRDLASALAYENMRYGLGKIIYALDDYDVSCVFGPDATITRNVERWESGFGYGAVLRWPKKGVFFPEIKPNACGMLLAKIDELPPREDMIRRMSEVMDSELFLDGVRVRPDFGHGNHFFEFYSVLESSPDVEGVVPKDGFYVLLHGSAPEKKGAFYGAAESVQSVLTPLGEVSFLEGAAGREYYRSWAELEDYSKRRREFILKEVLGKYKVVSNTTHQGLSSENEIRLGCYNSVEKALFPVAMRWDIPVYIFRGKPNLSEEVIGRVGFHGRAEETGLLGRLEETNILPHGGGYKVDLEYTKISVVNGGRSNHFVLSGAKPASSVSEMMGNSKRGVSSFGEMVIMNPRELPYDYRGLSVIEKTMEYELGTPVAKLQPLMTLKV